MLRPVRVLLPLAGAAAVLLAVAAAVLLPAAPAAAKTVPGSPPFRVLVVDHMGRAELSRLAARGAVGLLVPGAGPTTNYRQALAQMLRGTGMNAHLGGVPEGPRLISYSLATGRPTGCCVIVVTLPPKGPPAANDHRYPVAVLGRGFHGLLRSPTTRIPGLVSIVDIAPTALGRARGSLGSVSSANPVASLASLNQQIHANNRLKLPALLVVAGFSLFFALLRARAALTAIPAALLTSLLLGAAQVSNEVVIMAALSLGTFLGGIWLARRCRTDHALLGLFTGVVVLHLILLVARPEWVAITPLGPTQNSRFWGIGNQLETLLLAPVLAGAVLARRLFGIAGFAAFSLLALVMVTGNRFGSDGGGAIVLGVAFAFLGARLLRLGVRGFVTLLLVAATVVLGLVWLDLRAAGPNHLRSAFGQGFSGLFAVMQNRVPLSYAPAFHAWTLVLPLALSFAATLWLSLRAARRPVNRDLALSLGLAIVTSLLVNDSAAYVLSGGVAVVAAVVPFAPSYVPLRRPLLAPAPPLAPQPVPQEVPRD